FPFIENKGPFENRGEVWKTAFLSGLEAPLVGHGFGNVEKALKETSMRIGNNIRFQYVDSSHNILLDYWTEGGILGLGLLLIFLFLSFREYIQHHEKSLLAPLLGICTVMLFNPVSVVTLVAFWFLIGQGVRRR